MTITRMLASCAAASVSTVLIGGSLGASGASPSQAERMACAPSAVILHSSVGQHDVQAKALNDRGDIVGFADTADPDDKAIHAILWKDGKVGNAVDLGVLPGYVSSEAYGVNNGRVVFGLLYDEKERTFPFRWEAGRMTVLKGPHGQRQQADAANRNTVNERGQIVGTLLIAGRLRAVRWSPDGTATLLPALAGHTQTYAFSINSDGIVSGWSRKQPDGEENPVLWDSSGNVIPLKTAPGRSDGIAEATNRSGLTVGYLGNLGVADPERDNAVTWQSRTSRPRMLGRPARPYAFSEVLDINDRGEAAATSGSLTKSGFTLFEPAIWRTGWTSLRPLPIPAAAQKRRVVVTYLDDINNRGDIVGNVLGFDAKDFSKLRRIDAVLWRCPFSR